MADIGQFDSFRCTRQQLDGAVCLTLRGYLDIASVAQFRAHLSMAVQATGGLMLDLRDLRYLDSSGVYALLETHRVLSRASRRMALVRPSTMVRRILSVVNVEWLMPAFPTVEEALKYLGSDQRVEHQPLAGS